LGLDKRQVGLAVTLIGTGKEGDQLGGIGLVEADLQKVREAYEAAVGVLVGHLEFAGSPVLEGGGGMELEVFRDYGHSQ
jgi:hypothetical protein